MLFLLALSLPLAACGKKGDLYLPTPTPAPTQTTPNK
jgi:predicted small lipoprotein YifL